MVGIPLFYGRYIIGMVVLPLLCGCDTVVWLVYRCIVGIPLLNSWYTVVVWLGYRCCIVGYAVWLVSMLHG